MHKGCVFCDLTKFKDEKRLIFEDADDDGFFVIAARGQLTNGGHVLIVPKQHIPCMVDVEVKRTSKLSSLRLRIQEAMSRAKYPPGATFEHGKVGPDKHACQHILPVQLPGMTRRMFRDHICDTSEIVSGLTELWLKYEEDPRPYYYWTEALTDKRHVCWYRAGEEQSLRSIVAEVLGVPERGDWRTVDKDLDQQLCVETANRIWIQLGSPINTS